MGAVEVVVVQPWVELLVALKRGLVGAGVSPFAQGGLDEALGLSVGARSIGAGEAVFDMLAVEQQAESSVSVAAPVVGEHAADGDGVASVIGPGHEKKQDGGAVGLVGQDGGEGDPRVVVDPGPPESAVALWGGMAM